jgi:peptidoglycan/xylan/chitin deacetylase (PgdA/CDA1 family)
MSDLGSAVGRTVRRLVESPRRGAVILMYHRIAEPQSDPWTLAVSPAHFAEHLEVLRRRARPVPLADVGVESARGGRRRVVAVTFDDGYLDNLTRAVPLLERHDVPATVFVTSGYVGSGREFWWDELDRLVLGAGILPRAVHMRLSGVVHDLEGGGAEGPPSALDRRGLFDRLYPLFQAATDHERRAALDEFGVQTRARPPDADDRPLNGEELGSLASRRLVEIGSHTVSHPVLSLLPAVDQWREVDVSRRTLESWLGRPIRSFAYPYGARRHYSRETVGLVRRAGYLRACASFPGTVHDASDPFELPRLQVRDCDGEAFERMLSAAD